MYFACPIAFAAPDWFKPLSTLVKRAAVPETKGVLNEVPELDA
jgi:hypothetical protein